MKTASAALLLGTLLGIAQADTALIPASPGVEADLKAEYGGATLKTALVQAGAPLAAADTLRFDVKAMALAIEADPAAIGYVRTLLAEFYSRTPVQRDAEEIARRLVGKTAAFRGVDFHPDPALGSVRFDAAHAAAGLDAEGKPVAALRWAVSRQGDIHVRHSDGRLLLTGNLNAPGHLVFTLARQSRSYDIALQPR